MNRRGKGGDERRGEGRRRKKGEGREDGEQSKGQHEMRREGMGRWKEEGRRRKMKGWEARRVEEERKKGRVEWVVVWRTG